MKRSIKVREQELIDKLNSRFDIAVDPALEGSDKTEVIRWDNHGPVQFEEEDTKTTIVKEEPDTKDESNTNDTTNPTTSEGTRLRPHYEEINHPLHYNNYDVEVIDMMERIFGTEATATFCKLNAFKYRMRAGTKPNQSADKDLNKEQWYLNKMKELQ